MPYIGTSARFVAQSSKLELSRVQILADGPFKLATSVSA